MTNPKLIDLGNEVAFAQAERRTLAKAYQEATIECGASESILRTEMVKQGVDRFDLDDYREVVWIDDDDEIAIIQKG